MSNAWEQRKLKQISEKVIEKNIKGFIKETFTNSAEHGIINQRDFFNKDITNEKNINNYYIVNYNDFIYNPRISNLAPVGPINRNRLSKSGIMSPLYYIFRTKDIDHKFLEYYFNSSYWHRFMELNGDTGARSDRFAIKDSVFREMPIPYPEHNEQIEIGEFLEYIKTLITLHQRKLDDVKKLKAGLLQKMFPKNGENVPEIRFPGFNDAWEQRKLGTFVEFYSGLTYSPDDVKDSGTLVLRSSNVKNGEIVEADNVYVASDKATSEKVKDGDIIVVVRNGSRALIGKHAEIKGNMPNAVIGAFMSGIRSEHPSFVNALLDTNKFEKEIEKNMGATINQITGYMFSKMEFMIPCSEEQDKIGEYFRSIDHLITLHQRKPETPNIFILV